MFSEQFVTCPYPMPGESVPLTPIFIFLRHTHTHTHTHTHIYIYISSKLHIDFSRYLISFKFFFKSLYIFLFSPMPATYAAYLTIPGVIILIMRNEIIFIFVSAVTKIRLEHFVYVSPPLSFKRF